MRCCPSDFVLLAPPDKWASLGPTALPALRLDPEPVHQPTAVPSLGPPPHSQGGACGSAAKGQQPLES
eukprot:3669029-Alexandrium_andersonii.AAC.1